MEVTSGFDPKPTFRNARILAANFRPLRTNFKPQAQSLCPSLGLAQLAKCRALPRLPIVHYTSAENALNMIRSKTMVDA
jgi:hypothetical protein